MRKFYLILLIVCCRFFSNAQGEITLQPVAVVSDSVTDFTVDNLGNIYLLTGLQQLKKMSSTLDSLAVYNNVKRFGKLDHIDASNPLRVILFYKDFNTVIVLDRFLNARNTIDLRSSGIFQSSAIGQSYDNNLWVFDEIENKIKKLDDNGKVLLESPDFRIVFDSPPTPTSIEDYNKYVYAYDSSRGLLIMDYFGAYKNLVAYTGWRNLHGIADGLVATDSIGLVYYRPGNPVTKNIRLPEAILLSKKIRINANKLYALQPDGRLHIYNL